MRVIKRDNTYEDISFDKVLRRIRTLCNGLDGVSADEIAQKVCARIYDGVKTYSSILQNETFMKYVATNVKTYEKAIELSLAEGLNLLKNTNK